MKKINKAIILLFCFVVLNNCQFYHLIDRGKFIYKGPEPLRCFSEKKIKKIKTQYIGQLSPAFDIYYSIKPLQISSQNNCVGIFEFRFWDPGKTQMRYFLLSEDQEIYFYNDRIKDSINIDSFLSVNENLFSYQEKKSIKEVFLSGDKSDMNSADINE